MLFDSCLQHTLGSSCAQSHDIEFHFAKLKFDHLFCSPNKTFSTLVEPSTTICNAVCLNWTTKQQIINIISNSLYIVVEFQFTLDRWIASEKWKFVPYNWKISFASHSMKLPLFSIFSLNKYTRSSFISKQRTNGQRHVLVIHNEHFLLRMFLKKMCTFISNIEQLKKFKRNCVTQAIVLTCKNASKWKCCCRWIVCKPSFHSKWNEWEKNVSKKKRGNEMDIDSLVICRGNYYSVVIVLSKKLYCLSHVIWSLWWNTGSPSSYLCEDYAMITCKSL